ncbi:hypothetical protein [Ralstonia insidiosa]|uniref:Uncharacterized protein n=1 Tax=Ralstonia insidiosa TaxID=190721 RepID=A0A848P2W9_9RALS|nr:hypothetical protein [Ralstonia insidiosa]NMV39879.1 hypothetical protein [Ralstonia insidiosa]
MSISSSKASPSLAMPTAMLTEIKHQVKVALGRLEQRIEPQVITWNGQTLVLRGADSKRADAALRRPGCLGVYSDDATFDELLTDLLYVMESRS